MLLLHLLQMALIKYLYFLSKLDKMLLMVHACIIGPVDTKAGRLILKAMEELQCAVPNLTVKYDKDLTSKEFAKFISKLLVASHISVGASRSKNLHPFFIKCAVPNLTVKYDKDLTSKEFAKLCASTALVTANKWFTASARPTIPNIPVNNSFFINPSLTRKFETAESVEDFLEMITIKAFYIF